MDIRNYFSAKPGVKPAATGTVKPSGNAASGQTEKKDHKDEKKKKKMVIDSSDEEDEKDFKSEKKTGSGSKLSNKTGSGSKSSEKTGSGSKTGHTKLKETSAADFFSSKTTVGRKSGDDQILSQETPSKKTSQESSTKKTSQEVSSKKPSRETPSKKRKAEEQADAFAKTLEATSFSPQSTKKHRPDSSPSLANKLASKKAQETVEVSSKDAKSSKTPSKRSRSKTPTKSPTAKRSKSKTPEKSSKTPKSSRPKSPKRSSKTPEKASKTAEMSSKTPTQNKKSLDESVSELPGTPQEEWEARKKVKQVAYQKFLTRGGAKNPGSKVVPEGSPGCMSGLVFVLTGVYDSLEREEMGEIIKQYGGKVTQSVSRNTSYLVVGDQAGESKLEKGRKLGTKTLSEDEFLNLILERRDPKLMKEKENKTPSPEAKREIKPEIIQEKIPKLEKVKVVKAEVLSPKKQTVPPGTKVKSEDKELKLTVPKIKAEEPTKFKDPKAEVAWSSSPHETQLFVEKYKPTACKNVIGQQGDRSNMAKLRIWLKDWNTNHLHRHGKGAAKPAPWGAANDNGAWAKCALLSGPPGVGKTTTAYLVAQELGYDIVEYNASDTRSKRLLQENVSNTLNTTSVSSLLHHDNKVTSKRVLLMDEVDGMAGNEDRGGIAELIALLKTSKVPVIAMCNDRNHQKIRSLANHCFDLRFQRPRVEQIKAAMLSVCFKEKIKIKPDALQELIIGCGQDIRQVLHHLSMIKAGEHDEKMDAATAKKEADMSKKTSVKMGPWDVCKKVFSAEDHKTMSLFDKSDLYFYDYNLAGLFVQENYLSVTPKASGGNKQKTMELISKTASSLAEGDIVERGIRSGMNWSLLPTAAIFNSVLPGEYMSGFLHGQIQFPSWLGKNSRRNKMDRILQELQMHTRLTCGASKTAFNLDYSQPLRDFITRPLRSEGSEGVDAAVQNMETYALLREDLDGLIEVTQWPDRPDILKHVESKTKAAFTRKYNKDNAMLPYSVVQHVKKKAKEPTDGIGDEDDGEDDDEAEDDSIEADAMIKIKKPTKGKKDEDKGKKDEDKGKKGSAKVSKAPRGKGKGK